MAHTTHAPSLKELNFDSLLIHSWETFKKKWLLLLGLFVLSIVIQGGAAWLQSSGKDGGNDMSVIVSIISWVLSMILSIGWINIYLKTIRGEKVDYQDLYNKYPRFIAFVLGTILTAIIVGFGFILLIVPGVVWSLKYMFVPYLLVDKKIGVFEALKESAKMTQGEKWRLFWYGLGLGGVNLVGVMCLLVGVVVSAPVTALAGAVLYNSFLDRLHSTKK